MTAPLGQLLPSPGEKLTPDAVLDRFVGWVGSTGISLYEAQEEAILALLDGKHVVLSTPTGSGKSLVATFLHYQAMAEGKRSFYTCPIKALVNEKFFALCEVFGADNVGMVTGDGSINADAPIVCCTAEILANLALREDEPKVDAVVMDEFHYYADRDRGSAWQIPLLLLETTTFLLMSATLGDTEAIETGIREMTRRDVVRVRSVVRPVPLGFEYAETPLHETLEKLIESGRYPVYLVNFTQRAAAEQAQNLMSVNFATKGEKEAIRDALEGVKFTSPNGKDFQRHLRHGIGLHHAGLLPKYRLTVEKLAQQGLLKVISGTDTLGMGINIPLKTVLFTQLCKYDGEKTGILSARDFHQISGRAGRKGFDTQGYVVAQAPEHVIENKKLEGRAQAGKKVVKRQPPAKGYVHWDSSTFEKLQTKEPEKLESRFEVSFGLLLSVLQSETTRRGGGYGRLVLMIERAHESDNAKKKLRRDAARKLRTLRAAGLVDVYRAPSGGSRLRPGAGLQHDFSLLHTLSLYLLDSLPRISPEVPTYAFDVLSQVESILENPDVVLWKQLDRIKTEKMMEMKRSGVEYDERIAELEKLEWTKPNRDFVYATFNEFAAKHPWVGAENIRPKSVARDMLERFMSFEDYVLDYGLERSEGVLLRYLSQVYKALAQNVPESTRTEEMDDILVSLRTTIRGVDSSLVDEWEQMRGGVLATGRAGAVAETGPPGGPTGLDARLAAARIRTDLHRLVKALAKKDYAGAAALLVPAADAPTEWNAATLEATMAPYWNEHKSIDVTPLARRPQNTAMRKTGPMTFEATQKLLSPPRILEDGTSEEVEDWALECVVDFVVVPNDDAPILTLRRIVN